MAIEDRLTGFLIDARDWERRATRKAYLIFELH
jgi:hypothetical protein